MLQYIHGTCMLLTSRAIPGMRLQKALKPDEQEYPVVVVYVASKLKFQEEDIRYIPEQ